MSQSILIIDDNAAIGNLEQEALEREGYAVLRLFRHGGADVVEKCSSELDTA